MPETCPKQIWLSPLLLPLSHHRVPVACLKGPSRSACLALSSTPDGRFPPWMHLSLSARVPCSLAFFLVSSAGFLPPDLLSLAFSRNDLGSSPLCALTPLMILSLPKIFKCSLHGKTLDVFSHLRILVSSVHFNQFTRSHPFSHLTYVSVCSFPQTHSSSRPLHSSDSTPPPLVPLFLTHSQSLSKPRTLSPGSSWPPISTPPAGRTLSLSLASYGLFHSAAGVIFENHKPSYSKAWHLFLTLRCTPAKIKEIPRWRLRPS